MGLPKLHQDDLEVAKLKIDLPENWKDIESILHYQALFYILKIICSKIICRQHNYLLADYFETKKTRELVPKEYLWPTLHSDDEAYIKGCDVYLTSKADCYKL